MIAQLSTPSSSGVAILVHRQFTKNIIRKLCISDRLMAIDVTIGSKIMRIVAVYMPHAGYTYEEFSNCFEDLSNLLTEAADHGKYILVGGDFNLSF